MKIKLQEILDDRNISIYSLSKEVGVAQNNLSKLIKGETTSIKYDILEKICIALRVTPNDIFEIDYPYPTTPVHDISQSDYVDYIEGIEEFNGFREIDLTKDLITISESEALKMDYQARFHNELIVDELVSSFINKIIEAFLSHSQLDESIRQIFKDYKNYDYFTTNLKINKYYRVLNPFLSNQSKNNPILKLLTRIRNIYNNGGLDILTDNDLDKLQDDIKYYLD